MKRLLVAGAGFLGCEIIRQASAHFEVTSLTKNGDHQSMACDLSSTQAVHHLAKQISAPDYIIFSASSGRGGPEAYREVFLQGTRTLKETFPDSHLLFTSSTSVYHQTNGERVDEKSSTQPDRETSQILLEVESQVDCAARLGGLYGPKRSVIVRKFMEGSAIIEEDGRRILNQIHVADAASACLLLAAENHRGVFNVTDNRPMSQLEVYSKMSEHFHKPLPPVGELQLSRKRAWTHKAVENHKLRALGWEPNYPSFLDALDTLLEAP
jgi:nucleoside-diphosphate-sugar epimerase